MHSRNFSYVRKRRHDTCLPTGPAPAASRFRSHAGLALRTLRSLFRNDGLFGPRQWAGLAARVHADAPAICDVFVLKNSTGRPPLHSMFHDGIASLQIRLSLSLKQDALTDPVRGRGSSTVEPEGSDTGAKRKTGPALWYGSCHIWVQSAKRTLAVPWVVGFGYSPSSCVRYCPVTVGVRQCLE